MSGDAAQAAHRFLILSDSWEGETECVQKVVGQRYHVATLADAQSNGIRSALDEKPVLFWTHADDDMHGFALELASPEIKYLTGSEPSSIEGWTFAQFKEWALPLIEIINRDSPDGPSPSDAVERSTHAENLAASPVAESVPDESRPFSQADLDEYLPSMPAEQDHPLYTPYASMSADDPWPEPVDLWGGQTTPEADPIWGAPEIMPYVFDQADRAGVDPAQVMLNCTVICAALIRTGIELQMQQDMGDGGRIWAEKPILWGAVCGEYSTKKGPALDIATHRFRKIASDLRAKDEAAWKDYDREFKTHEARMRTYHAAAAKDSSTPIPEEPEKPPRIRLWTDDVTKETVAKLICENPYGKITLIKEELSSWYGSFSAYSSGKLDKDGPDWLVFYDSKERYIDRSAEGRSYRVPSWGGCILGGIQPDVIRRISSKLPADGMQQRFQVIVSKPARIVPARAADTKAAALWNTVQDNLAMMEPRGNPVRLSSEAAAFMAQCQVWIGKACGAGIDPALAGFVAKGEGLLGRLMITSHCIADAARGQLFPSPEISLKIAQQCWRWFHDFLFPHAINFYTGILAPSSGNLTLQSFLEHVMRTKQTEIKPSFLMGGRSDKGIPPWAHYRNQFGAPEKARQRKEFFDNAVSIGLLRPSGTVEKFGQTATAYKVNPMYLDGRFNAHKERAERTAAHYREVMDPRMGKKREAGQD